eukprot:4540949-Pyramimonas_sp.AAC.1
MCIRDRNRRVANNYFHADQILLATLQKSRKPRGQRMVKSFITMHSGTEEWQNECSRFTNTNLPYATHRGRECKHIKVQLQEPRLLSY